MSNYAPTIGLEIHAELKTKTKMFCDSLNDPEEKHPNTNVCPICAGHPGTLPVINKSAVEAVLKVGMALNGDIPQHSKFDRKNYFYPDLPKGYQISQYDLPLIFGGVLNGVRLTRIHLEEDTGRLIHQLPMPTGRQAITNYQLPPASFVDLNRAGVPLMELVSEPDIKSVEQAVEFAKELQLILRYLGVSDADMEKGQMRVEVNVSLRRTDAKQDAGQTRNLGTKVEVKNINSFKAAHDAIQYEIERQAEVLEKGEKVVQETRGWNDVKKKTVSQRLKEEAHDYRYFPEPDLPPLDLSKFDLRAIKISIPELPKEKRARFAKEYGLAPEQIELLIGDRETARYFEETISEMAADNNASINEKIILAFNYFTSDLRGLLTEKALSLSEAKITPENFADLIELISVKKVSSRAAKDILRKMLETGLDPNQILQQENLSQVSGENELKSIVEKVVKENPNAAADYKKGKVNALQFLVGKAMAELKGRGNPEVLQKIFRTILLPE
ncbi:MAG: glutaminyl-tRNA synthase (glutamine-hydrolyzing) subunit B [Candidatus Harrisonbacteria bacterium RIFCSPHIGHO2_01_FULL_44_13]|uniref:Aspartyl/glutamyl-tRNA(Asn/Gln) amidotransferase subunit B n=1 Tax=Candidatus Harrisonbacteria bacterium RIFCSPLOWO2_01_FULL_44_18 TaxID=1798407 RepID=A0A1G1ZKX6_9BACT|nr:MAG: glutaminyl-tRNA synthase (glutamine-hydrolyzing) subunit B [Candidatus Harrisonbacteria bacterium RIFCSPHIGHO2_01_FULL_44_13]OGY65204.1 MAG: glutaminyl-tRNA synthase (glutamine-hydrolyzing) subunit B [Candidatus Harrisonbacteria bacterium RIFCSPLOWO2_01_FULL_44_18]